MKSISLMLKGNSVCCPVQVLGGSRATENLSSYLTEMLMFCETVVVLWNGSGEE
jgi:hypothetical protein